MDKWGNSQCGRRAAVAPCPLPEARAPRPRAGAAAASVGWLATLSPCAHNVTYEYSHTDTLFFEYEYCLAPGWEK